VHDTIERRVIGSCGVRSWSCVILQACEEGRLRRCRAVHTLISVTRGRTSGQHRQRTLSSLCNTHKCAGSVAIANGSDKENKLTCHEWKEFFQGETVNSPLAPLPMPMVMGQETVGEGDGQRISLRKI